MADSRSVSGGRERVPAPSPLRRLDARLVPHLQRSTRRVVRLLGWPLRVVTRAEDGLFGGRPARRLLRHRQVLVLAAAVIAFAGSYVHLQRYPTLREARVPAATGGGGGEAPTGEGVRAGPVVVGPAIGADVESYVAERREALAGTRDGAPRLAVVSFARLLTADQAAAVIGDDVTALAAQLRVPAEGEEPFRVDVEGDLPAAVDRAVAQARDRLGEEEADIQELLGSDTVTDEEFDAFYRAEVDRLAATRNLLDAGTGTVFAVVVRGTPPALRDLAAADGVRLVDVAPAGAEVERATFYGLLPSDLTEISYGAVGS